MANPILILAEQFRGQLSEITYEMLGAGRKLADALQAPLYAALLGREAAPLAAQLGKADKVFLVDNPALDLAPANTIAAVLKGLMEQQGSTLALIGGTNLSIGIGSFLSARTQLPYVNYCRGMRVEEGGIILTSQVFGGKILTDVKVADGKCLISIYPGAFPAEEGKSSQAALVEKMDTPLETSKVKFTQYIEPDASDVDITKQNVLIAVGRGIQTQDNLSLAEDLAASLGGTLCASRPVIDQGWLPLSRQVGKSGMTVKPRLYLALGISGAPEHWEGMQNAECIIAINTDAKAPIFDGAHYGVCGDLMEIVPALTEAIKGQKG